MKNIHIGVVLILVCLISCQVKKVKDFHYLNIPQSSSLVNDFEEILDSTEERQLEKLILLIQKEKKVELKIITTDNYYSYPNMDTFSLFTARNWNIGKDYGGKGSLIAVSKKLKKVRIQNSDNVMSALTNSETEVILKSIMIPYFKSDSFYRGLYLGLTAMKKEL